jgi:hypothetical protein
MVIDPTSPTKDINRRLLLTLHQDGLLDVLAGLIVATFGMIPILDETTHHTTPFRLCQVIQEDNLQIVD